ncbi:family 31 glycosyltransferase [Xylariomycetidae sp. FL2044]|nr:family 31 glycosyltransferase [Xylariomycetidae sp. FL2044]
MVRIERTSLRSIVRRLSRSQRIAVVVVALLLFLYACTPYDHPLRSFFRFQHNVVEDYYQGHFPDDSTYFTKQRWPINPDNDVGIIIKSGYGTRHRVPVALEALSNESFFADTIVAQDFPVTDQKYALSNGKDVPVLDIINWNLERGALKGEEKSERILRYKNLAEAIEADELVLADGLGKDMGWELDAMKFLPSLEYAWRTMPKKKWYLMLDDDTYIIKSSLSLVVGHLNFAQPQFLGNPVGDYKGRFPHGGSSVIMSGAALKKLFDDNPEIAAEGHLESPTAIWGDKLLSTTFMKVAVYLDETYRRLFNGESPWMTRMWSDRLCLPLVAFHGLGQPEDMREVGETFMHIQEPVFWMSLGKIYGALDFSVYIDQPIFNNMDYVGRQDEYSTMIEGIKDVEHCVDICTNMASSCLAWTYDPPAKACITAPWALVGDVREGLLSGINGPLGVKLTSGCHAHA